MSGRGQGNSPPPQRRESGYVDVIAAAQIQKVRAEGAASKRLGEVYIDYEAPFP